MAKPTHLLVCPLCHCQEVFATLSGRETTGRPIWAFTQPCRHCGASPAHLADLAARSSQLIDARPTVAADFEPRSLDDRSTASYVFHLLGFFLALFVVAVLFAQLFHPPLQATGWAIVGSGLGYLGLVNPWWFRLRPDVQRIAATMGSRGVRALYLGLALLCWLFAATGLPFARH